MFTPVYIGVRGNRFCGRFTSFWRRYLCKYGARAVRASDAMRTSCICRRIVIVICMRMKNDEDQASWCGELNDGRGEVKGTT
ncbi:hypothetical protein U1Q18_050395 [Sarracenia purpurea var. burkii]